MESFVSKPRKFITNKSYSLILFYFFSFLFFFLPPPPIRSHTSHVYSSIYPQNVPSRLFRVFLISNNILHWYNYVFSSDFFPCPTCLIFMNSLLYIYWLCESPNEKNVNNMMYWKINKILSIRWLQYFGEDKFLHYIIF